MQVVIGLCVFFALISAFAAAAALAYWLPLWLKPLAIVPIMIFARYGAGKTWIESVCLVGMIGGLIALGVGVMKLIRMVLHS